MSRLYPCVYCTEDGYCKKYSDGEVTSWCVQSPCKDEKPSNADRIRAMTDEELADMFTDIGVRTLRLHRLPVAEPVIEQAKEDWLDWLKEEADHD